MCRRFGLASSGAASKHHGRTAVSNIARTVDAIFAAVRTQQNLAEPPINMPIRRMRMAEPKRLICRYQASLLKHHPNPLSARFTSINAELNTHRSTCLESHRCRKTADKMFAASPLLVAKTAARSSFLIGNAATRSSAIANMAKLSSESVTAAPSASATRSAAMSEQIAVAVSDSYSHSMKFFHWATAAGVLTCFGTGMVAMPDAVAFRISGSDSAGGTIR